MDLNAHVITVGVGEDIAAKIISFSQQGPPCRNICILTANGAISKATLHRPSAAGGSVTHEGHFEILTLSGSYLHTDECGVSCNTTGGLTVTFSCPDGSVLRGGIRGELIAASEVKVTVLSFKCGGS